jgi:hypothetical protein
MSAKIEGPSLAPVHRVLLARDDLPQDTHVAVGIVPREPFTQLGF